MLSRPVSGGLDGSVQRMVMFVVGALAVALGPPPAAAEKGARPARVTKAAERARARLGAKMKKRGMHFGQEVFLRAFKEEAELEVWLKTADTFERLKTYPICAASGGLGPKERQGDGQVPEGFYAFGPQAMNPASSYHLSFDIGYPNAFDRKLGRTGSLIMVHGDCVSVGCLAMTNDGIDEIYSLVDAAHEAGQRSVAIHLFPFRMTEENMHAHERSAWRAFWENLKAGYDLFERDHLPPNVRHARGRYTFESAAE